MKVIIQGSPREIAALVVAIQERQAMEPVNVQTLSDSIRGILLEFAKKS